MKPLCVIGLPAMAQQILLPLSQLFILPCTAKFGTQAIAAMGAGSKIDIIASMPAIAVGSAVTVLTGHNIGAGRTENIKKITLAGLTINIFLLLPVVLLVYHFAEPLIRLFVNDRTVTAEGVGYLHIISFGYFCFAVSYVTCAVTNGAGKTIVTFLISFISLCIIRVPLAYILSASSFQLQGVWISILLSQAATAVNSSVYLISGKWKNCVM